MKDEYPSHTSCCSSWNQENGKSLPFGAGLVFFSGGTALNETAKALASRYPSTHIITTFDSGGSTAELRKHFDMPAVGDIRARLLALADDSLPEVVALKKLMAYRLPCGEGSFEADVGALREGSHHTVKNLSSLWAEMGDFVKQGLAEFMLMAGDTFDYGGACVGNILLAVQYFRCHKDLQQAVDILGGYLKVQGRVIPVSESLAHLAVALETGEKLVGQHRFTGKWEQQIQSPIADIWLVQEAGEDCLEDCAQGTRAVVKATEQVILAIACARCLCYPIGSFFSSVAANLLVKGVGQSIARASCPKIFIPNPGADPELLGLTLLEQVHFLLRLLQRDAPHARPSELINGIVVDRRGSYVGGVAVDSLKTLGIELYEACLLDEQALEAGDLYISGELLAQELMRLFTTD